jgi:hypothetical protein
MDDWAAEVSADETEGAITGETHDGMPIRGYNGGEPIPDLSRIPQEGWKQSLRPLSPFSRRLAVNSAPFETVRDATALVGELMIEDGPPPHQRSPGRPPRMPAGDPPPRGASRQVNFRLGPGEYARLVEAAELYALRPAALARLLTVRGIDRALYEERRDR